MKKNNWVYASSPIAQGGVVMHCQGDEGFSCITGMT